MNSKYKSVKDDALESICINDYLNRDVKHDFLKTKWKIIKTDEKGNCFYDSLSKFGSITRNNILHKTQLELRHIIVNAIIAMAESNGKNSVLLTHLFPGSKLKYETKIKKLNEYLKADKWYGTIGDVIPQLSAQILNININIYDLLSVDPCEIYMHSFNGYNTTTTVNLIRTGSDRFNLNHYRLLMPIGSKMVRSLNIENKSIKHKSTNSKINSKINKNFNKFIRKTQKQKKESLKESIKEHTRKKENSIHPEYKGRITRAKAKELQDKNLSKVFQNTSFF